MQFPTSSRVITQQFGENPTMYAQFGFPGHNGIDFAEHWAIRYMLRMQDCCRFTL
jgi:hypothetical protein